MTRTAPPRRDRTGPAAHPFGFRVESEPAAVAEARHRIVSVVRGWGLPLPEESYGEVELLSSELITNAIRYSPGACAVTVRWTGARVRVEVTDTDPVRPRSRRPSAEAEGGRGLYLVESLSADWGSTPGPAGKTVWFEIEPPSEPAVPASTGHLADRIRAALPGFASIRRAVRPRRLRRSTPYSPVLPA